MVGRHYSRLAAVPDAVCFSAMPAVAQRASDTGPQEECEREHGLPQEIIPRSKHRPKVPLQVGASRRSTACGGCACISDDIVFAVMPTGALGTGAEREEAAVSPQEHSTVDVSPRIQRPSLPLPAEANAASLTSTGGIYISYVYTFILQL